MHKQNRGLCLLLVLALLATAYIFYNSFKDGKESNESSDKIVEIVEPIIGEIKGEKDLSFWVRKAAHVIEFAVLGVCAMSLGMGLKKRLGWSVVGYVLFYVLITAVTDEFIQSHTGRTSSVKDIFLDFGGALLGILIANLVALAVGRARKKA